MGNQNYNYNENQIRNVNFIAKNELVTNGGSNCNYKEDKEKNGKLFINNAK